MDSIMDALEAMDITKFELMTTDALKVFLSLRKQCVKGSNATLAARYVSICNTLS